MAVVDLLGPADTRVLHGDTARIVDLTGAAHPVSRLTVTGAGDTDSLSPISQTSPELVPLSSRHTVSLMGYDGDTTDQLTTIDTSDAMTAVLLTGSGRGWIIPAAIWDPGPDAQHQHRNANVATVDLQMRPTARGWIIETLLELAAAGVTIPALTAGRKVLAVITTAGTLAGAARKTGIYETTIAAGATGATAARGWLAVARPDTPGAL